MKSPLTHYRNTFCHLSNSCTPLREKRQRWLPERLQHDRGGGGGEETTRKTHVVGMEAPPHRGDQVELSVAPVIAQHVSQVIGAEPQRAESDEKCTAPAGASLIGGGDDTSRRRHPFS